ncbi:MAG: DMT family transporter [Candidatus Hodarchaeales archaeon]
MKYNRAYLLMIIAASLWGTTYTAVKIGLSYLDPPLPPIGFLFLRFMLASVIVLIPLLSLEHTRNYVKELFADKLVLGLGIINSGSYIIQFIGQKGTSAGIAALFVNMYLISTPIFAWLVLNESLTSKNIVALVIGFLGVCLVSVSSFLEIPSGDTIEFILSSAIVFISGIVWGGYSVISKLISNKSKKFNSLALSNAPAVFAVSNVYSIIIIFVSMLILNQTPVITKLNLPACITISYLAIFGTVIPFVLTILASQSLKATEINILIIWNIVVGLILAVVVLRESFTLVGLLGSTLILWAIYLTSSSRKTINNELD